MSNEAHTLWRVLVAITGIGLSFGYYIYHARGSAMTKRIYGGLLIVTAIAGVYLYLGLGPQFKRTAVQRVMNPHDFYHYYIGAKYFEELGFFDLYECSVIADQQGRKRLKAKWKIRDLRTYGYRTVSRIAMRPGHCREQFTSERWNRFRADVDTMSLWMPPKTFNQVLKDKGYNATPVWTMYASRLAHMVPLDSVPRLYALLGVDWLFTLLIFGVVIRTFGWRAGLLAVVFWGANVMSATGFVKGSLSRLDWLACVVGSLCLIRRDRYLPAGILAGLATSLRVFPGLFFVGLVCKAVYTLIRTRQLPRRYLEFGAASLVTLALLMGVTALTAQGRSRWGDFETKITSHDRQIAGYRVGFKYAVIDAESMSRKKAQEKLESNPTRSIWWASQILMLTAVFAAAQRLRDHQTVGLSFVCVFFLTAPTFYYYQMLVVPFLLFLPGNRRIGRGLGMAVFFGWSALGFAMALAWPLGFRLSHWFSWSLFWLCAFVVARAFAGGYDAGDSAAPATDPESAPAAQ